MSNRLSLLKLKKFDVEEKRKRLRQIDDLIAELEANILELKGQIEEEHRKTGIDDETHFAYSTFAKSARLRCEKMRTSITTLSSHRVAAEEHLNGAIEEWRKVETLVEREHLSKNAKARRVKRVSTA